MRELRPIPFAAHLRRLIPEMTEHGRCYDYEERTWHKPESGGVDFRTAMHGAAAGTPLGPAAGPHTQMAQNLVLAYVMGARIFELKTIQIMDRLQIPRPCIDARNICFNVEWSQELRIEESIHEYCIAAYLISIIRGENLLKCESPLAPADDPIIWDISVGYDLAGIQSKRVRDFLGTMKDASAVFDRLDAQIPAEFAHLRRHRPDARLSRSATLSTFHGCPKDEIEKIVNHLLEDHGLHTIIKMNPTMLGQEGVEGILRGTLGYEHLHTNAHAYEVGLRFEDSLAMMRRLVERARGLGLSVGAKFSNTLETMNTEGVFDAAEKVMYLSGAPLHVITSELAAKWATAMDWREPLSFSAGVDSKNVAEVVANGCAPVTTCTDLLKPGGYGRLTGYLTELKAAMEAVGSRTINQYVRARAGGGAGLLAAEFAEAGVALDAAAAASVLARAEAAEVPGTRAVMCPPMPGKAALEALASGGGSAADLAAVLDRATRRGMLANWKAYAAVVVGDDRYAFARNNRAPKKIKSHLDTFDCINCDKCIPACPNDAMFSYEVAPVEVPLQAVTFVPGAGFKVADLDTAFAFKKEHQLANFADWCNECSNCQTYCPEQGGPFIQKPRFYGDRVAFLVGGDDGYYLETHGGIDLALLRVNGVEYEFEWRRAEHRATLRDEFMIVEYDTRTHKVVEAFLSQVLNNERTVDSTLYHLARTMVEGVLHSGAPNPVRGRALAAAT